MFLIFYQSRGVLYYYLRQVNEVNRGDTVFVRYVSVCVSVRSGRVNLTIKATDFKFDMRTVRTCTLKNMFLKRLRGQGHVTP